MTANKLILDTIEKMKGAGSLVIYGAAKRAELMLPFCEAFVNKDKICVVVSKLQKEDQYVYDYRVHAVDDIRIDPSTVVMVATGEEYFDEIRHMPQLKEAKAVICLEYAQVLAAKRYAIQYDLQKLGIDPRLFDRIQVDDLIERKKDGFCGFDSISIKAHQLATEESARFALEKMRTAKVFPTRDPYHDWLKGLIRESQTPNGINMEFGVFWGDSLRRFADDTVNRFYGFDSFEGLPEDWFFGCEKGEFKLGRLPDIPNAELVKGWFNETLPVFVKRKDVAGKKADFIHIDCDLYSSTKTVFEYVGPMIKEGTIIAFDEYFNYPGWQMDEYKAFQEFVETNHIRFEYLAYTDRNAQVCVRVTG